MLDWREETALVDGDIADVRPITGDELLRMGDIGPCELIDGRIVPMSPTGGTHGRIESATAAELRQAARTLGIKGVVFTGEVGIYTARRPDRVRGADVAFMSAGRAARVSNPDAFLDVVPELIVEIVSPDNPRRELEAKAAEYLAAGAVLVLVLDPSNQTGRLHRSGTPPRTIGVADVFEAPDILPGVQIPLASFFDA